MGRTRLIKYSACLDVDLAQLPPFTRLAFVLLPTIADREGRLEDNPMRIMAELFPYDRDLDMNEILEQLARQRENSPGAFITRYEVAGRKYLQINNFKKHQNPHPNEVSSNIPPVGGKPLAEVMSKEKLVQSLWANTLDAEREVKTESGGIADLVTGSHVIEVKRAYNWRGAMRQVFLASAELHLRPAVILFYERGEKHPKKEIEAALAKHSIPVIWGLPSDYTSLQLNEITNNFTQHQKRTKNADLMPSRSQDLQSTESTEERTEEGTMTSHRARPDEPKPVVRWEPKPTWKRGHPSLETTTLFIEPKHILALKADFPRVEGNGRGGGVEAEIRKFKRHWLDNPSKAKRKKDWILTLTNWLKNADERFDDARFRSEQSRASPEPKSWQTLKQRIQERKEQEKKGLVDGDTR